MVEFEEQSISWRPIIIISLVLIVVVAGAGYLLFFQGGALLGGNLAGQADTARYKEIVAVLQKANPAPIVGSDFYKNAVVYKIDVPSIQLGKRNPFSF